MLKYCALFLLFILGLSSCHKNIVLSPVQMYQSGARDLDARKITIKNDGSQLQVFLKDYPIKTPILTLPLDRPFLSIEQATTEVEFNRGSFKFDEKSTSNCQEQSLESIAQLRDTIVIRGNLCGKTPYSLYLKPKSKNQLDIEITLGGEGYNRIHFYQVSQKEETFWGMGTQYSEIKLNGNKYPIWTEEQGIGRGDQPLSAVTNLLGAAGDKFSTYAPIPFYLSSENKAFALAGSHRSEFDFSNKDLVQLTYWSHHMEASLWQATNPLQLIEAHTKQSGRIKTLPDWVYGNILGLQGGKEKVVEKLNKVLAAKVPVDAIWIQDWVGSRSTDFGQQLQWNWQLDKVHYPEFNQLKYFCESKNIKMMAYINPFLAEGAALEKEAKDNAYFVKNQKGDDYLIEISGFKAHLLDLTNPRAYQWMKELIKKELIGNGFSGWMADFGEWLPWDAKLHKGNASEVHNLYPVIWAKLNREAIREMRREHDIVFFSRAGFSNIAKYSNFMWLGDQMTNWGDNDGLGSVVPALLSSGISGLTVNHADIGGFTSIKQFPIVIKRNEELLKRWIELSAFTPIFRNHESIRPDLNLQVYDKEIIGFYNQFAQIHQQLKPYLRQVIQSASSKGIPVIRHLYLHYPGDEEVYTIDDQYLLGREILVAPVLDKNINEREVYFPEGQWTHLFTQKIYNGPLRTTIKTPVGSPAVFINGKNPWRLNFKK